MSKELNIFLDGEVTGYNPDMDGDTYEISDAEIQHNYMQEKIAQAIKSLSSTPDEDYIILYGGEITDGGSGTVDISEGMAIGKNSDGDVRIIYQPELTGVSLPSGWNDDRQIWGIGEHTWKTSTDTRNHHVTAESYHYTVEDSYTGESASDDLFVDSDPNTSEAIVCWGSFQMNGTTFTSLDTGERTRTFTLQADAIQTDTITEKTAGNGISFSSLHNIQSMIREYVVETGESVTAGQVVEYINGYIRGGVGSETTPEPGFAVVFESAETNSISACLVAEDKVLIAYGDVGNSSFGTAIVCTISGTVPSFGSAVVFESAETHYISACLVAEDKVLIAYRDAGNSDFGTAIVCTISGTVPSFGSAVVFESAATYYISACLVAENKVLIAYRDVGNSNYGTAIVCTISGTVPSFGSAVVFESAETHYMSACLVAEDKVLIAYQDGGTSDFGTAIVCTISGTVPSFGSAVVFKSAEVNHISACLVAEDKVLIAYQDGGNSDFGTAKVVGIPEILGVAQQSGASEETILVATNGISAAHSNLLSGMPYYADSDGNLLSPALKGIGTYIGQALSNSELLIKF